MKRAMFFAERMLYGEGNEPFNIVVPVKINGKIDKMNLHNAMSRLQDKHPFLRASIQENEHKLPFFNVDKDYNPISIRQVERLDDRHWQTESMLEWNKRFDCKKGPLIRLVWLKGDNVSEILLVMHHCLCDGGTALTLLADMLTLADNYNADIGSVKPIMGIEDIVPANILKSNAKQVRTKMIALATSFVLWMIPVKKKDLPARRDFFIHWKINAARSKAIIARCKTEGITVNTLLSTVLLDAFRQVRGNRFFNKVSCPVDIRRFAPEITRDTIFSFGLMFVVQLDKSKALFESARKMQADVNHKTKKLDPYATLMMFESAHSSLNNLRHLLTHGKSSNDCMFSNLGKLEIKEKYESFSVDTIYSPSVIGPLGNTTTLITSTYKQEMDFSFVSSEEYLLRTEALQIKDKFLETLVQLTQA